MNRPQIEIFSPHDQRVIITSKIPIQLFKSKSSISPTQIIAGLTKKILGHYTCVFLNRTSSGVNDLG